MTEAAPLLKRHVAAVVAGNALEFYDFLTYSFFALYIGRAFFPSANPASSLLLALATFGAGFVTRPIGGLVIGSMADRIGRRPAMFLSFALMGVAIVGVALTPAYARIGIAAPILVLGFRLVQGFALGGEVGPTTAYLIEAARPEARGFYGTFQGATQYVAVLSAGVVGTGLANLLDAQALQDWGWRIAFLAGAAIVPVGLIVQRSLPETIEAGREAAAPLGFVRSHLRITILGLVLLASATISTYVTLYLSTYAMATLHLSPQIAFGATVVLGICGAIASLAGGLLSDRLGRKPVAIFFGVLLLVAVVPSFAAIGQYPGAVSLWSVAALLSVLLALSISPIIVAITESLSPSIRAGAFGTIYALAIAVFGGSAQFNVAWLTDRTGDPLAPAYYMTVGVALGLVAMVLMRESAPVKLSARAVPQPAE
jgi:MFS family permease